MGMVIENIFISARKIDSLIKQSSKTKMGVRLESNANDSHSLFSKTEILTTESELNMTVFWLKQICNKFF